MHTSTGRGPHRAAYLVLASQRSGSTLLVESLKATGVAGRPEEFFQYLPHSSLAPQPREWFADVTDETVLGLLDPLQPGVPDRRPADAWAAQIRADGRSPNGVWGGKLMWNQTRMLVARAETLTNRSGCGLRSALVDILGVEPLFIHVSRADVVPQAVSFWRAVQTQVWRGKTPPELDARAQYHADGIAHLVRILRDQEDGWRGWFAAAQVTPVEVSFDDLAADPQRVVASVLEKLGLDPAFAPPPPLRRQGDDRSAAWIEQYRRDAAERGLPL